MTDKTLEELLEMHEKTIALKMHPVGCYYTSDKPTDPHEFFGGTWRPIQDVFLYCAGPKHAAGEMGGEETHKLTVEEMPSHSHQYNRLPQIFADTDFSKGDQANFIPSVRDSSNTEFMQTWNTGGAAVQYHAAVQGLLRLGAHGLMSVQEVRANG